MQTCYKVFTFYMHEEYLSDEKEILKLVLVVPDTLFYHYNIS